MSTITHFPPRPRRSSSRAHRPSSIASSTPSHLRHHLTRTMSELSLPSPSSTSLRLPTKPTLHKPPTTTAIKAAKTLTPTALLLPALLGVATITLLYDLYSSRRRYTPVPILHHCLLFRSPNTPLDHPKNRVFCVRADRNILASGLVEHCFFDAEVVAEGARRVGRVRVDKGGEVKRVLRLMMEMKKEVDNVYDVPSPLQWGTEGRPARRVMREWVNAVGRVLREEEEEEEARRKKKKKKKKKVWWGEREDGVEEKEEEEEEEKGDGWVEVWDVRIRNRCEGWVVEPWHEGFGSLEDDDEMPFTWANGKGGGGGGLKIADRWPGSQAMCFKVS